MAVTMSDIAKETNSSISLVSAALKNKKTTVRVSEKKREAILQAANRLGYRPSHAARTLKVGKTNVIGMVMGEIHTPYYGEMASMIMEEAEKNGYSIQIYVTNWDEHMATKSVDLLLGGRCDGMILFEGEIINQDTVQHKHIIQNNVPAIVLSNVIPGFAQIGEDWTSGFMETAEYLVSKGIKDAAFLGHKVNVLSRPKLKALREVFSMKSINLELIECFNETDRAYDFGLNFKSLKTKPQVVLNENDTIATALLAGLHEAGVKIPQELAVIGYNDTESSRYTYPSLTTIGFDKKAYVQAIIELMIKMIVQKKQFIDIINYPTYLIRRNSA